MRRDHRLDTIRGILLIMMTINHLGGPASKLTFEPFGFVSAAAGFVLLSGYMFAVTGLDASFSRLSVFGHGLLRTLKLYKYYVVLMIVVTLIELSSPLLQGYWGKMHQQAFQDPWLHLAYGAVFLFNFANMDILSLYLVFTLLSPFLLIAFRAGHGKLVMAGSIALWGVGQFFDPLAYIIATNALNARVNFFNIFSWQLLWMVGLYFGYLRKAGVNFSWAQRPVPISIALILVAFFLLIRHEWLPLSADWLPLFERRQLGTLRMLNIISQIVLFCAIIRFFSIEWRISWFSYLGRHSLQVFCLQVIMVLILAPVSWRIPGMFGLAWYCVYLAVVCLMLTLGIMVYDHYGKYKKRVLHSLKSPKDRELSASSLKKERT